jgi:hypothetical protein
MAVGHCEACLSVSQSKTPCSRGLLHVVVGGCRSSLRCRSVVRDLGTPGDRGTAPEAPGVPKPWGEGVQGASRKAMRQRDCARVKGRGACPSTSQLTQFLPISTALKGADMVVNVEDRHLRIWADRPVTDPKEDRFGFVPYADAFALLINDRDTSTPLTVAISGPWGSGKTSLAKLLESRLKVEQYWRLDWREPPVTCWFNAWAHSDAPNLGAALAASVSRDVGAQRPWYWRLLSPLPSVMLSPEDRAWRRVWLGFVGASLIFLAFLGLLWLFPQLRGTSGKLGRLFGHWQILTRSSPGAWCFAVSA